MKRNLVANLVQSHAMWRSLRKYPGAFGRDDALLQFNRVILPQRFHYRYAGEQLARRTRITQVEDELWKVEVPELGLHFYWPQPPDNNLWFAIEQEIESVLKANTTDHWIAVVSKAGVPCGPINNIAQALEHPQVAARNMVVEVPDGSGGTLKLAGNPIKMSAFADPPTRPPAPDLDGDRQAILSYVGG